MTTRWLHLTLAAAVAGSFIFAVALATAAEQGHNHMKIGKTASLTFTTERMFGGFTLPPGQYSFRHFGAGEEHAVFFSREKGPRSVQPGGVKCRVEPLGKAASETTVTTIEDNGVRRITQIVIRGENVAHVFN